MPIYALLNEARTGLAKYPISLQREFPALSFRADPPDDQLAPLGVVRVREVVPRFDSTHDVSELAPELKADGHWHQRWAGVPNADRLAAIKATASAELTEAGRADWVARMAELGTPYVAALAAVEAATTEAEVRQAAESI